MEDLHACSVELGESDGEDAPHIEIRSETQRLPGSEPEGTPKPLGHKTVYLEQVTSSICDITVPMDESAELNAEVNDPTATGDHDACRLAERLLPAFASPKNHPSGQYQVLGIDPCRFAQALEPGLRSGPITDLKPQAGTADCRAETDRYDVVVDVGLAPSRAPHSFELAGHPASEDSFPGQRSWGRRAWSRGASVGRTWPLGTNGRCSRRSHSIWNRGTKQLRRRARNSAQPPRLPRRWSATDLNRTLEHTFA